MIKSIKMENIATYDETGIEINECKKINFIYGANGSGKTTISNFIAHQEDPKFNACSLQWEYNAPLPTLVYNKDFRKRNFSSSNIAGIFTLGQATTDEINAINKKKEELEEIRKQIIQKKQTILVQENQKKYNESEFANTIWDEILKKNKDVFREAFVGCLTKKMSFKNKLLQHYQNYKQTAMSRIDLVNKAKIIFRKQRKRLSILPTFNDNELIKIERNKIWNKKIIGKQDVNIAGLIQKLNISDWVNEGRKYLYNSRICPFCQKQTITDEFRNQLDDFFGGEYNTDTKKITDFQTQYHSLANKLINQIQNIYENEKANPQSMLELTKFFDYFDGIKNLLNTNKLAISNKIKEPSRSISLTSVEEQLKKINNLIEQANKKIYQNNQLIDNYNKEKTDLISNIWSLLISENKILIDKFIKKNSGLQKGINKLKELKKDLQDKSNKISSEIVEATKNITSVEPSVNEINKTLLSYGFKGFMIVPSSTKNYYQIQREDGSLATDTLSEGEISFITFLYFLQRAKGGSTAENITYNRVLVVDDPISSLDSNVLFIVSSLLKEIIESIKNDKGNIKQLFVLTHNVYFHKETSLINGRTGNDKDIYYWILRKQTNISSIQPYKKDNPIKTSYELLWNELREIKKSKNVSSITIQNIMRRIIENYFKILGKYGDDDLIKKFNDLQEQKICRSLLYWINDGSHCIPDDLYVDSYGDTIDKYFEVFKKIFKKSGHDAHYEMMMKNE